MRRQRRRRAQTKRLTLQIEIINTVSQREQQPAARFMDKAANSLRHRPDMMRAAFGVPAMKLGRLFAIHRPQSLILRRPKRRFAQMILRVQRQPDLGHITLSTVRLMLFALCIMLGSGKGRVNQTNH
jgi:hypothetical protein